VSSLSYNRSAKKLKGRDGVSIEHSFSFGWWKMIFLVNQLQIEIYRVPIWRSRAAVQMLTGVVDESRCFDWKHFLDNAVWSCAPRAVWQLVSRVAASSLDVRLALVI